MPTAILIAMILAACAGRVRASPCTPFDQASSGQALADLTRAVATQLHAPDTEVLQVFRSGRWRMVYVASHLADEAVLFFSGNPVTSRYLTWWSGAARLDEAAAMRRWAKANAPGIPDGLASCFGWYVTGGRTR